MSRYTKKEKQEFINLLKKQLPNTSTEVLNRIIPLIIRHSNTYHRLQEDHCNGYSDNHMEKSVQKGWITWKQYDQLRYQKEKEVVKKEKQIIQLLKRHVISIGAGLKLQGDPRGCTVKLTVPSNYTNDWGNEGICVPGA